MNNMIINARQQFWINFSHHSPDIKLTWQRRSSFNPNIAAENHDQSIQVMKTEEEIQYRYYNVWAWTIKASRIKC